MDELYWQLVVEAHENRQCYAVILTLLEDDVVSKIRATNLTGDIHAQAELVKGIAMAKNDFLALSNVWRRSSLTWRRKLAIFSSLIESKLLYGLSSICLTVAQERKLNGFQNRCLRKIVGVAPAYASRVSNATVLRKAACRSATDVLRKRR